jgi:hypothetical protein
VFTSIGPVLIGLPVSDLLLEPLVDWFTLFNVLDSSDASEFDVVLAIVTRNPRNRVLRPCR